MQVVPLGFNGPRFQKVFYHKRLTQITKLTSKNAINELSKHHRWSRGHKAQGQGQEHKKIQSQGQEQLFREQTLSRPGTRMLEAKAKDQEHRRQVFYEKKRFFKIFSGNPKKQQQSLQPHFSADRQKKLRTKTKAKNQRHRCKFSPRKKVFKKFFRRFKKKKKVFNHIFQPIAKKNGLQENISNGLHKLNVSKISAVLEDNF